LSPGQGWHRRANAQKSYTHLLHAPAAVIPVIFSAGGGLRACDDELLPCPEDRNGRHWVRVELSTILIKYAFKISIQFWARRDNSVVPLA
jgi:hypothetical protein